MDWIMISTCSPSRRTPGAPRRAATQSSTSRAEKLCTDALKAMLTQFKTPDGEPDEDNVTRRLRATKGVGRDAGRAPAAPRGPRGSRCQSTRGQNPTHSYRDKSSTSLRGREPLMPNDNLREPQIADARKSNSCSGFSDFEFQELKSIAETYIAASGLLMTLVELAGHVPQSAINQLPEDSSLN